MVLGSKLKVLHYEKAVQRYEERPVETGKILFYGDSLFTRLCVHDDLCHRCYAICGERRKKRPKNH